MDPRYGGVNHLIAITPFRRWFRVVGYSYGTKEREAPAGREAEGRTHGRTRPMLQQRSKVLAKAKADLPIPLSFEFFVPDGLHVPLKRDLCVRGTASSKDASRANSRMILN